MDLDRLISHVTHAAAGEMQMEIHEIGAQFVSEADLKRATRRAIQMQIGRLVLPEGARGFRLEDWPGRLLGPDLVMRHPNVTSTRAFAELKWCRTDKIHEVLWDLLKLTLAAKLEGAEGSYLIVGAPTSTWEPARACADLLDTGQWNTIELFERYERQWRWLLEGNKTARPIRLPAQTETLQVANVPIHVADDEDWELRATRVRAVGEQCVEFEDGWPRVSRSVSSSVPVVANPAPAWNDLGDRQ